MKDQAGRRIGSDGSDAAAGLRWFPSGPTKACIAIRSIWRKALEVLGFPMCLANDLQCLKVNSSSG